MSRPAVSISKSFRSHLTSLEFTRLKIENLLLRNQVVRRDVEQVYAGLFLKATTLLERSIEDLFIGLLTNTISANSRRTHPRVTFKSHEVARSIVFGGNKYVDWFPYHLTKTRANAFFRNGHPFSVIRKRQPGQVGMSDFEKIERIIVTRNALAHKSRHAIQRFEAINISGRHLRPTESTPTGFLRVAYRHAGPQNFFELLTIEMAEILEKLCTS